MIGPRRRLRRRPRRRLAWPPGSRLEWPPARLAGRGPWRLQWRAAPARCEGGSIVLFVLFVCLAVAVVVQTLTVVVLCADRSLAAENDGRARMEEKDEVLAVLRQRVLVDWRAMPWSVIGHSPDVQGRLTDVPDADGLALVASARHSSDLSPIVVSACVERGRDGLDLPLAGLVGGSVTWVSGRTTPWLDRDPGGDAAIEADRPTARPTGYLVTQPVGPPLAAGVTLDSITEPWRLDEGWRKLFENLAGNAAGPAAPSSEPATPSSDPAAPVGEEAGTAAVAGVTCLHGRAGTSVSLPPGWGTAPDHTALLVLTGGADIDVHDRGDLYGVIVVDGGSVALEGTVLHGALFATGRVDLGNSGALMFSETALRWATDQSLERTRLVPGTRGEAIE